VSYRILQGSVSDAALPAAWRMSSALFGYKTIFSISQQDKYCNMSKATFPNFLYDRHAFRALSADGLPSLPQEALQRIRNNRRKVLYSEKKGCII
jgi:hypothetical protein